METPSRRSRMHRTRSGKRIELSARDVEIFRALARHRYVSSTYIHAFVGGASETRLKERLGDLFHEGYIDRPAKQWDMPNCRYRPAVYELGIGGRRALDAEAFVSDDQARTWLTAGAHRQFAHSLMTCEVLASLELEAANTPGLRFIPWCEIATRAAPGARKAPAFTVSGSESADTVIVPDALFGLEYATPEGGTYRFFAIEADRDTMPIHRSSSAQSSLLRKVAGYREIVARQLYQSWLGVPNLFVLFVLTNEARKRNAMDAVQAVTGGSTMLLFQQTAATITAGRVNGPMVHLLRQPWERAGQFPLSLASAD